MTPASATPSFSMGTLVGRANEVSAVGRLLDTQRLVTLTGPPGVGKSRVAYATVTDAATGVEYGPFWVDLCEASTPEQMLHAVSRAVGAEPRNDALLAEVAAACGARHGLLVLDNADRVLADCSELIRSLLGACSGLRVLVTSRESLAIAGEELRVLSPLPIKATGADVTPGEHVGTAVDLFRQRARAVHPGFVLDATTTPIVQSICRRLDGLPLAIELAAGRAGVLSPQQIEAGLDDHRRLLKAGPRATSARHRSMESALSWTDDLIGPDERILRRRLGVFPSGCTLEAAEAVCAFGELNPDSLLDALDRLVSRSLVAVDTSGEQARYRLLEVIRHRELRQLQGTDEVPALAERFTGWCVLFSEQAEKELAGPEELRWLGRLDAEWDNLRAGLNRSVQRGDVEPAVRLAAALALYWRYGRVEEGKLTIERLASAARQLEPQVQARLLWGLAMLATTEGRFAGAVAPLRAALRLAEDAGDGRLQGRALLLLANCALVLDGPDPALPMAQRSVALSQEDDPWCAVRALVLCSWAVYEDGDSEQALLLVQEAVAVARRSGLVSGLTVALNFLGFIAGRLGEHEAAEAALLEALHLSAELRDVDSRAIVLTNLADVKMARGQLDEAGALAEAAVSEVSSGGTPWAVMQPLLSLGRLAEANADHDTALSRFNDVLAVGGRVGFASVQAQQGLGRVAARAGDDRSVARQALRDALASAEQVGSSVVMADALHDLGALARSAGQLDRAGNLHRRALRLRNDMADRAGVAASLEALAGLSVDQERFARAARLFGAAEAIRRRTSLPVQPSEIADLEADVTAARAALGDRFGTELSVGGRLSIDEAVAAACGRRASWRPTTGWASLTKAERDVVGLVGEGLTNRQVGERLLISRRTVQTHLSHVFAKLGVRSRTELVAHASLQGSEGQEPQ